MRFSDSHRESAIGIRSSLGSRGLPLRTILAASILVFCGLAAAQTGNRGGRARPVPLTFATNAGQTDGRVAFLANGSGWVLFLTWTGLVIKLARPAGGKMGSARSAVADVRLVGASAAARLEGVDPRPVKVSYFIGNDPGKWQAGVAAFGRVAYRGIYPGIDLVVSGSDTSLRLQFVSAPGAHPEAIRMRVQGDAGGALDSNGNLVLSAGPGAGAGLTVEHPRITASGGETALPAASGYQLALSSPGEVGSDPAQAGNVVDNPQLVYSTLLSGSGAPPVTTGNGQDQGQGVAVDANGRIYVTGIAESVDFPVTSDAFQAVNNGAPGLPNVSVSVIDPIRPPDAQLIYSTYLGGSGAFCNSFKSCTHEYGDWPHGIELGPNGLIYIAGWTWSPDFPVTAGAFQPVNKAFGETQDLASSQKNAFLTVIDPAAPPTQQLVYSTYLGGAGGDEAYGLAVDAAGLAYVGGLTASADFPVTKDAFQRVYHGQSPVGNGVGWNGFLAILDPTLSGSGSLKYSTFLGGGFHARGPNGGDNVLALALGPDGLVYLTGTASSQSFPTTGSAFKKTIDVPHHPKQSNANAFLTVLNPAKPRSHQLVYSSYLGGTNIDYGNAIAVGPNGLAYIAGETCLLFKATDDFPVTPGAFQVAFPDSGNGGCRAFFSELDPHRAGKKSLLYSTYLGGGLVQTVDGQQLIAQDTANGVALNNATGFAYLIGTTADANFPVTTGALQPAVAGAFNVFLTVLDPAVKGSQALVYSTYLGGARLDYGNAVALGSNGLVCLAGATSSVLGSTPASNWPVTANAIQRTYPGYIGGESEFVTVLNPSLTPPAATSTPNR
jgi:hypothetical protein